MTFKKMAMQQGMKFMSDPRVMKMMQDERLMKAMMAAMSVPGRITTAAQEQTDRFAKSMALATEQEVKDLRRAVRSLEEEVMTLKTEVEKLKQAKKTPTV